MFDFKRGFLTLYAVLELTSNCLTLQLYTLALKRRPLLQ
jgi:hypothetical protein